DRQINGHLHLFTGLNHADYSIVMLNGKHQLRNNLRRRLVVRLNLPRSARSKRVFKTSLRHTGRLNKDSSTIAAATRINEQSRPFVLEEPIFLAGEELCCPLFRRATTALPGS